LSENGIDISSSGKIKYPAAILDNVLRVIRYYPDFVIKHVKEVGEARLNE